MKKPKYVKICPKCGSPDHERSNKSADYSNRDWYTCNRCGFKGLIFPEVRPTQLKKLSRQLVRKQPRERKLSVPTRFTSLPPEVWAIILLIIIIIVVYTLTGSLERAYLAPPNPNAGYLWYT